MIILKADDGSIAVMTIVEGADKDEAIKKFKDAHPDKNYTVEQFKGKLPDREFRDAWTISGNKIVIDKIKATEIHMARIRHARNLELDVLDKEQLRYISNPAKMNEIEDKKQLLRDLPVKIKGLDWPDQLEKIC